MKRTAPFRLNRSGVLLALLSAAFAGEAAAVAGRAEFVIGGVTVTGRDGVQRVLVRGTELDNGDTVRTNDGRAQVRFTDGAYVSLQPNSEYSIRDYRFDNRTDGTERGFFGLLKGAMRTVTGAIGRVNRDRYQITTPTATVGIRGTGGVIQVQDDGSTLVIGTSGIWSLTNPAGSVDVPAGTSALAPTDPNQPPQETTQPPTSGPAPVQEETVEFVAGEERDESGTIVIPQPQILTSGSGFAAALAHDLTGPTAESGIASLIFNGAGQMTRITASSGNFIDIGGGSHADFGTDGTVAWGRWIGPISSSLCSAACPNYTFNQGFHYVVGMPTATMPTTATATYALLGATQPTYVNDIGVAPGTFSGMLNVDFGMLTVGMSLNISMPDSNNYAIGGSASISGSGFSGSHSFGTGSLTLSGGSCGVCGCQALVTGFFSGTNADRAGLSYHVQDSLANKDVIGAAAFQKQ